MNMEVRDPRIKRKTATPHIELRMAGVDDVARIVDFLGDFFARSRWADNLTFQPHKAMRYLLGAIGSGYAPYVTAWDGDELVGLCSYHTFDVFTDPVAVMDETYVVPRYHRTDLGRRPSPTWWCTTRPRRADEHRDRLCRSRHDPGCAGAASG